MVVGARSGGHSGDHPYVERHAHAVHPPYRSCPGVEPSRRTAAGERGRHRTHDQPPAHPCPCRCERPHQGGRGSRPLAAHRRADDLDRDRSAPGPARRLDVPDLHLARRPRRRERGPAPGPGRRHGRRRDRGPRRPVGVLPDVQGQPRRRPGRDDGPRPGRLEGRRRGRDRGSRRRRDDRVEDRRRALRHLRRLPQGARPGGLAAPHGRHHGTGLARLPQAGRPRGARRRSTAPTR